MAKRREIFDFALLFLFVSVTLSIPFLHTEKSVQSSDSCPACHFQNSTLATHLTIPPCLPQPSILGILKTPEFFEYTFLFVIEPKSRAPPQT
jgi:hypothetical protein